MNAVELASLLCSRLCHDLLSPVGALNNGIELLADEQDPEMRERCLELLAESARASANKLKFFRLAFGAGGGTDVATRILADGLSEALGQQFVVENRPGAGGTIAGGAVAKAPKDGYNLLAISMGHSVSAVMVKQVGPTSPDISFNLALTLTR